MFTHNMPTVVLGDRALPCCVEVMYVFSFYTCLEFQNLVSVTHTFIEDGSSSSTSSMVDSLLSISDCASFDMNFLCFGLKILN